MCETKTEFRVCWEFINFGKWTPKILYGWTWDSRPFSTANEASNRAADLSGVDFRRNIHVETRTVVINTSEWTTV